MAMTLLAVVTASGDASADITTGINGTYHMYEIYGTDIVPGTDASFLSMRVSTDGGSTWKQGASDYSYYSRGVTALSSTGTTSLNFGRASVGERQGSAAGENGFLFMSVSNPAGSSVQQCMTYSYTCAHEAGNSYTQHGGGAYKAASAIDAVQFFFSAGTISGEFRLYGIQAS